MVTHLLTSLGIEEGPGYTRETELWRGKKLLAPGPELGIPEPLPWLSPQIHRDAWRHPSETHLQTRACTRALGASQLSPGQARPADGVAGIQTPLRDRVMREGLSRPSGWLSADPERASAGAPDVDSEASPAGPPRGSSSATSGHALRAPPQRPHWPLGSPWEVARGGGRGTPPIPPSSGLG